MPKEHIEGIEVKGHQEPAKLECLFRLVIYSAESQLLLYFP